MEAPGKRRPAPRRHSLDFVSQLVPISRLIWNSSSNPNHSQSIPTLQTILFGAMSGPTNGFARHRLQPVLLHLYCGREEDSDEGSGGAEVGEVTVERQEMLCSLSSERAY